MICSSVGETELHLFCYENNGGGDIKVKHWQLDARGGQSNEGSIDPDSKIGRFVKF